MKASVEDLLADMDLDKSAFRLGNTQVSFFLLLLRTNNELLLVYVTLELWSLKKRVQGTFTLILPYKITQSEKES